MRITLGEEQQQPIAEMDIESIAKVVFRGLKRKPKTYLDELDFSVDVEDFRVLFLYDDRYQVRSNDAKLLEAITLLERRGLVVRNVPEQGRGGNPHQFIVYLTSIGIESNLEDEVILLVDKPEHMVRALEQEIDALDDVVRQYYLESIRAYQEGLYILSVLGLGAASERAIHWLAESMEAHSPKYQTNIKKKREGNISSLTGYLSNTVIPDIFGHDKKFEVELKDRLGGLGKLYRENRNEAGHPQTVEQSWSREDQQILLLQFDRYITTICKAIGML